MVGNGYRSVDNDSLITLTIVLKGYLALVAVKGTQHEKDAMYELQRVEEALR